MTERDERCIIHYDGVQQEEEKHLLPHQLRDILRRIFRLREREQPSNKEYQRACYGRIDTIPTFSKTEYTSGSLRRSRRERPDLPRSSPVQNVREYYIDVSQCVR